MGEALLTRRGGSGGASMNVFVQESEPAGYEGIWIQANKTFDSIHTDNGYYNANTWVDRNLGIYPDIPDYFYYGTSATVGTKVYLIGGSQTPYIMRMFDTVTKTYTTKTSTPYKACNAAATSIGTDIYYSGGTDTSKVVYKYSTTTDTYTRLKDAPVDFVYHKCVAVGTNIYLTGGEGSHQAWYRYSTTDDTYTNLNVFPYSLYRHNIAAVGNYIYVFGTYDTTNNLAVRMYDILTNTFSGRTNTPQATHAGCAVAIGTDIYILGGAGNFAKNFYKYDSMENAYTELTDVPYAFSYGCACTISDKIYLFGGSGSPVYVYVQVFSFTAKPYPNGQFIIVRNDELTGTYYTQMFTPKRTSSYFPRFLTGFNNAALYQDDTLYDLTYPTYYGTGSAWVKFKN